MDLLGDASGSVPTQTRIKIKNKETHLDPTCACLRSGLRRLRAAPPQLQLLCLRRSCLVPVAGSGYSDARQHSEGLRDEAFQALVGLLPPERHLRRHDALPLDDEDAFLAGAVLEATVALVTFEPRQHAVVPTPRTLGGPLERSPGLGHRSPHVKVGGPVAIHSASALSRTHKRMCGGREEARRGCSVVVREMELHA